MTWTFDLASRPFDDRERDLLEPELHSLGSDSSLLDVWSATVSTGSGLTSPRVLRVHERGDLVGAAVVMVCRDFGRSFFASPALCRALRVSPPIWYWERSGLGTDGPQRPRRRGSRRTT